LFIIAGTVFLCFILSLLFYSLFLLLPVQFIKAGLITPYWLLICFFILVIIPASILTLRIPFFGKRFLNEIIDQPYFANDIEAAIELEKGKSFPARKVTSAGKKSAHAFLSNNYINKIQKYIKPQERLFRIFFTDNRRIIICLIIIFISIILSFMKSTLITDVYAALKAGLPAELIAIDKPIEFEMLEAVIIPPAYMDSGATSSADLNKKNKISVMQGSSVLVKGIVKDMGAKSIGLKSGRLILSAGSGVEYFPVTVIDNRNFEAAFLAPKKGAFALDMDFVTGNEIKKSGKSKIFTIEALPDQPPSIKIFFPPEVHNLVFGNPVEISFTASDDYGILEISLYHRDTDQPGEYNKQLVARFPKDPQISYSSTYAWNPVIREGEKLYELVYPPSTKTVEYFLEVRDINSFSAGGIARSGIRQIHFTDVLADLKTAMDIIHELITDGKKLLSGNNEKDLYSYKNKLNHAVDIFTKELKDTLPQSNLVQRTTEIMSALTLEKIPERNTSLKSYIEYLERFLIFMNLLMETETADSIEKELSQIGEMKGDMDSALKRSGSLADMLEKEFSKDIEEINRLMKMGKKDKAQAKMAELMQKIRKRLADNLNKSMAMSQKISEEVKAKLEQMTKQAKELLNAQELNKSATDGKKLNEAAAAQESINRGLNDLSKKTDKLSSDYPFIMFALKSYSEAARLNGSMAMESLWKSEPVKSSNYQNQVIRFLKGFLDASSQQKQLMEDLAKGNFERLMSRGYSNRIVLIPKEAVYTIPIDYKTKVIEMSKDRSKSTKEKEDFWRDILE
jgi:hypothetical protein